MLNFKGLHILKNSGVPQQLEHEWSGGHIIKTTDRSLNNQYKETFFGFDLEGRPVSVKMTVNGNLVLETYSILDERGFESICYDRLMAL